MDIKIRPAVKDDMPQVIELIKELASYEEKADQVKINANILMHDGFDIPNPPFQCFVAESNQHQVIGYALYYISYSTWEGKSYFLEDLYVKPSYRNQGIGRNLFLHVAEVAKRNGHRLDFHVLAWNPAIKFYEKIGAQNLTEKEEWHLFRLEKAALSKLIETSIK